MADPRGLRGHLEQQRGLADAGLTGQQDRGPGHQTAAEHPVELGHAAGARVGVLGRHVADADALQRELVESIGRTLEQSGGNITVRTTKQRNAARIEISGDEPRAYGSPSAEPECLTVPLAGGNAPE